MGLVAVGYDPGIGKPAVTAVEALPKGFRYLDHLVMSSDTGLSDVDRYVRLFDLMGEFIRVHRPAYVVGEEQRTTQVGKQRDGELNGNNGKTLITVGVGIGAARAYGAQYLEVRTKSARVQVMGSGTGSASKNQVQEFMKALLGVDKLPQDAAEAALNAVWGLKQRRFLG